MSVLSSERAGAEPPPARTALPAAGQLTVVPVRHPWRWVAAAAVLILVAQFAHGLVTNPGWDWSTFAGYFFEKSVMQALLVTLELTFAVAVLGFVGGLVLAPMRLSRNPVLRSVSWTYIWVFRSVPLIVQLLFWANLGYLYDTLQIGVPFGRAILPSAANELVNLLKNTSVVNPPGLPIDGK